MKLYLSLTLLGALFATSTSTAKTSAVSIGRHQVRTVSLPQGIIPRSATFMPSGKLLVVYFKNETDDLRAINLATMNDDGSDFRPFFSQSIPVRPKDNGIRYMVFPDNRRIFTGDFVIECAQPLEKCQNPQLLPVTFPADVADGDHVAHRWSEIIVAPDNRHVAWTTLLSSYVAAVVITGELKKHGAGYVIAKPRIVSTTDGFKPDPAHEDGVIPQPVRGGEVKQFVHGGTAISFAGAIKSDLANSTLQHLATGRIEAVTDTPGYTETTIFSPDERLGLTMTTRFSDQTDLAILGLLPKPYPTSLNMGLSMFAYSYGVTGVRRVRPGNIGPALIDIQASKSTTGYLGVNLNTDPDWVFGSPMSWHPSGKRAMWTEILRGSTTRRFQIVDLPDYRPGKAVAAKPTPQSMAFASTELSVVPSLVKRARNIDVKVYGRKSGYIRYTRTAAQIEKIYTDFSDNGDMVWSGRESMQIDPAARSTYSANIKIDGKSKGLMDLTITFGPIAGPRPAQIIFDVGSDGRPQSRGFSEYRGTRLDVSALIP